MELSGKTVAFVGGFGGIGLETSKHLLKKSLKHLIILDKDENSTTLEELKTLATNCAVHFYKFDVTMHKSGMQQVLDEILKVVENIDVFIHGAGICNEHQYELTLQVNLAGFINCIALILPHMDKRTGGLGGMIVSIASMVGLNPVASLPIYSSTKAAMISITRSLSSYVIYAQTNVSFIVICPGATKTPLLFSEPPTFLNLEPHVALAIKDLPAQSADVCGENIVTVLESGKNGDIWMLSMNEKQLVVPTEYCKKPTGLQ